MLTDTAVPRSDSVIYRESLPVALATLRTINSRGADVKGAMDFLHGCLVDLELRRGQGAAICVAGTVSRVYPHGAHIDFAPQSSDVRAALEALLRR